MTDYFLEYDNLIEYCSSTIFSGYTEKHHVIPKCLGGPDDIDNLVSMPASLHYEAHRLLSMMYPKCHPLCNAWWIMTHTRDGVKIDANEFEVLRERYSKLHSERMKGKNTYPRSDETKKKLSDINKGKVMPDEVKRKISKANKGRPGQPCSDETKKKLSDINKGKVIPREIVDKIANANRGKKRSAETIANMKESAKTRKRQYEYLTPLGVFSDYKEAAEVNNIKPVTLLYRCKKDIMGFSKSKL